MKKQEIITRLRKFMEDANGKGSWKEFVGSQLEGDVANFAKEYAMIKSQEAFEHGKNVGHANAIGDSIYGSGFENKDINFDEWL